MNIKQIPLGITLATLFALSGLFALVQPSSSVYAANSKEITCADGETVTARKGMKPDKEKLDNKDFNHACRNNDGYDPDTEPGGTGSTSGNTCGGVETSIIKCDADNSGGTRNNGLWQLLLIVVNILTAGIGIVAVGGIVYGSVLYTTAGDKADQVKQAVDIIVNVVIGLVLFALMWSLLNFIVPGGVFN